MMLDLNTISKVCPHLLCRRHCHFKHGKYSGGCIRTWSTCRLVELCKTLKLKHSSIVGMYIQDKRHQPYSISADLLCKALNTCLVSNLQLTELMAA